MVQFNLKCIISEDGEGISEEMVGFQREEAYIPYLYYEKMRSYFRLCEVHTCWLFHSKLT